MARTIKNDDSIKIKRRLTNTDGITEEREEIVGRFYFEASRELKECTMQIYLNEPITDTYEKQQLKEIYLREYTNFINDTLSFGWDMLDVRTI